MGGTSVAEMAFRLIGSLAVVVGLLFLLSRLANKRGGKRKGQALTIIAKQPLSRSSHVSVVTIGDRVLVLGTTDQKVSLLAELDPDELDLEEVEEPEVTPAYTPVPNSVLSAARSHLADSMLAPGGTPAKAAAPPRTFAALMSDPSSPLSGSLLSRDTWKQTIAALTRAS